MLAAVTEVAAREPARGAGGDLSRALVSAFRERPPAARTDPGHGRPAHPLAPVLPLLRDTLLAIADETLLPMVVTDAQGRVLWRDARRDVLQRAERAGLLAAPPTGPTAHPARAHHVRTRAARAVHDPDTGEVVGAVDVTGPLRTAHPTTLALVLAAAQLAEAHLAARLAVREAAAPAP